MILLASPVTALEPPICSGCESEITGPYIRYDAIDLDICGDCARAETCRRCGLPRTGWLDGADGVCTRCVSAAPRCTSCGLPILDTYWTIEGADGRYCDRCRRDGHECGACGAPVSQGVYRAGRFFCSSCAPRLLVSRASYDELYERMLVLARDRLGLALDRPPALIVESPQELQGALENAPDGLCGLYERDGLGRTRIRILSNLTEARAAAVLAHELAHAWQARHCPESQGTRLREGFAEWVAWKLLEGWDGADRERKTIRRRTDDYGHGFRTFAALEERTGVEGAIWYARVASSGR